MTTRRYLKYRAILGLSHVGDDVFIPIVSPVDWPKVERALKAKLIVKRLNRGVCIWRKA